MLRSQSVIAELNTWAILDYTCLLQATQMCGNTLRIEDVMSGSNLTAVLFCGCIVEIPQPVFVIVINSESVWCPPLGIQERTWWAELVCSTEYYK